MTLDAPKNVGQTETLLCDLYYKNSFRSIGLFPNFHYSLYLHEWKTVSFYFGFKSLLLSCDDRELEFVFFFFQS